MAEEQVRAVASAPLAAADFQT